MSSITQQERDEAGARLRMLWGVFWGQQEEALREVGYVLERRFDDLVVRRRFGSTYEESFATSEQISYRRGKIIDYDDGSSTIEFIDQSSNTGKAITDTDGMFQQAKLEVNFRSSFK